MSGWMIMGLPGEVYTYRFISSMVSYWINPELMLTTYLAPDCVYTEKRMIQSHYLTTLHIVLM